MRARPSIALSLGTALSLLVPWVLAPSPSAAAPAQAIQVPAHTPAAGHDPNQFIDPIAGSRVISSYGYRSGRRHEGTDMKGAPRATVRAAFSGRVVQAGPGLSGYGNTVTIDHGRGVQTYYTHLASWSVRRGQVVPRGAAIGVQGATGRVTTAHLHYEVWVNGAKRDPAPYLNGE